MKIDTDCIFDISNNYNIEMEIEDASENITFDIHLEVDSPEHKMMSPDEINIISDGSYLCTLESLNYYIHRLERLKEHVVQYLGVYIWDDWK